MFRRRLVAGNWKMNCTIAEARALAEGMRAALSPDAEMPGPDPLPGAEGADVVVCPPFTALSAVADLLRGSTIALGAQNMYFEDKGAYTGEISPAMLLDTGCTYVILGHSERRRQMGESSDVVNRKVKLALSHGLTPIVCVGETWSERSAGHTEKVIYEQINRSLDNLDPDALRALLIAYEPVWAIGTGQVATPDLADEVHRYIRGLLRPDVAAEVRILYGGSVTAESAEGLMDKDDVDGTLVGGASLKAESFAAIVRAAA